MCELDEGGLWKAALVIDHNHRLEGLQDSATITFGNDANAQDHQGADVKLYRNVKNSTQWFAFGRKVGWVVFPAEISGWQKREDARGICLADMREVPLRMGFNTGIPGAPNSALGNSGVRLPDAA